MHKNKINLLLKPLIILLLTIFILSSTLVTCFAYEETTVDNDKEVYSNVMIDTDNDGIPETSYPVLTQHKHTWEMMKTVYGGDSENIQELTELINIDPNNTTINSSDDKITVAKNGIWNVATHIYNSFISTVGYLFIMLYFLIDLIDKTGHDNFTVEHMIRQIIKLLIAILLMQNGMKLIQYVLQLSIAFSNMVTGAVGELQNQSNAGASATNYTDIALEKSGIMPLLNKSGIFTQVRLMLENITLIIPYLGFKITTIIIKYMCWARFIEIGLRTAFAPVGMADMFSNGLQGSGFRYFKKLCAVILQGIFIMAIISMVQGINAAFASDFGLEFFSRFIVLFAEIGLIKKSQSLANDLLGV